MKCGGFIFAISFNHVMCDALGLKQFLSTVAAMSRGEATHLIPPVWERHLLDARHPPRVTFTHHEYDEVEAAITTTAITSLPMDNLVHRCFFFGPAEVSLLRRLLPLHLHRCSKFELLAAFLWRCRSLAINLNPHEEVRLLSAVNARSKIEPPFPQGYYGNAFVFPTAITTVKNLGENPLGYAVELVKQAKASLTEEYMKSVAALMVIRGKRLLLPNVIGSFVISDVTKARLEDVDFGWGKAVFAGAAKALGVISFFVQAKNKKGEVGTLVPICLPAPAMDRFARELDKYMLKQQPTDNSKSIWISSAM
ncbi:hypothetical protein V6N11_040482 [Hibiscus sabdariffa]|uniref:Benzyl alcohol O-benzoyltransferase n=1 Tax=Hibiscus sabdariffa TaxID=183260 RepID=A0ABR2RHZ6_9ROSI